MVSGGRVKDEILEDIETGAEFDAAAFLYASVLFFGSLTLREKKLSLSLSLDRGLLLRCSDCFKKHLGIDAALTVSGRGKKTEKYLELTPDDTIKALGRLSAAVIEDGRFIGFADGLFEGYRNERAFKGVLQLAFLKNGVVRTPEGSQGYYLEMLFNNYAFANDVKGELLRYGIKAKLSERNDSFAVYIKDGESVCAFLALIRAYGASLSLQELLVLRGERNNSNRRANCDSHNLDKSALACVSQVLAIIKIEKSAGGIDGLPEALKETAKARLKDNTASIKELAAVLGVSKSCVQHRLKRLIEIAGGLN